MKLYRNYFLIVLAIFLFGCDTQIGYLDLDKLYADFVVNLKDSNNENLRSYCFKITPDDGTVDYMKKNNFSYRGIPEELEKRKMQPSQIGEEYYKTVLDFKKKLIKENKLDDLTYIGREKYGEEILDEKRKIYATETFILIQSKGDTIRCKLGEMFKLNGKWKSFTDPKLGW